MTGARPMVSAGAVVCVWPALSPPWHWYTAPWAPRPLRPLPDPVLPSPPPARPPIHGRSSVHGAALR